MKSRSALAKGLAVTFAMVISTWASSAALAQSSGTWTPTGSLVIPGNAGTATRLLNGKVLMAGGANSTGILAAAELYDPHTGTFTTTGSMATARTIHQAVLLQNGMVLVAGGRTPVGVTFASTASAELYDPATGTWAPTGSMLTGRDSFRMTRLPNGKVLVTGGLNVFDGICCVGLPTAELYDPATGTFIPTGIMLMGRFSHTATLLQSGKVLIAGGNPGPGPGSPEAELYDPTTGTFTLTGPMVVGRQGHTAALLQHGEVLDGKVLVAGGVTCSSNACAQASAELYNPDTGTFALTGSMTTARNFGSPNDAVLLHNGRPGKVLVAGGSNISGVTNTAELYDPFTGSFAPTGSMTTARTGQSMTLLHKGEVLAAGGSDGITTLASAELFTP